jgi:chromate reductase
MGQHEVNILAISGSLRARSTNTEVLRALGMVAPDGTSVTLYLGLASLPHFNPDLDGDGAEPPPAVRELRLQVAKVDAIVICSPEYAHGVPGSLKNALDWLVSGDEIPFKPVGLINASSRATHAQESLAETLRTMSTRVIPEASPTLALDGRRLEADSIAGDPVFAEPLREVCRALTAAAGGLNPNAE